MSKCNNNFFSSFSKISKPIRIYTIKYGFGLTEFPWKFERKSC